MVQMVHVNVHRIRTLNCLGEDHESSMCGALEFMGFRV